MLKASLLPFMLAKRPSMLRSLTLFLACSPPCLAASDWIVGPAGSGADFDRVSTAVDAAMPGDSIFVLPGIYSEPAGVRIDKALTVTGAGSPVTRIEVPIGSFGCPSLLTIEDIASQDPVRLGGIELVGVGPLTPFAGCGMFISDCDGPVFLHDIEKLAGFPPSSEPVNLRVDRSADLTLERCSFQGVHFLGDCGSLPFASAIPAVRATDSQLTVNACLFWGGNPTESCFVVDGTAGLELIRSSARVAASVLEGSESNGTLSGSIVGFQGLILEDSSAQLFAGTEVLGGLNFGGTRSTAFILPPGAEITATDDVAFVSSGGNPPIVDQGGLLTTASERWVAGLVTPGLAPIGANVSLDIAGEPGSLALTYVGALQAAASIPGIAGSLQLVPSDPSAIAIATLDAAGSTSLPFALPNEPLLQGVNLELQTLGITSALGLSLSPLFGLRISY